MKRKEIIALYKLTESEYDVLVLAYKKGYFEPGTSSSFKPKNLPSIQKLAGIKGISASTFSHQFANARRKLLKQVCIDIFEGKNDHTSMQT